MGPGVPPPPWPPKRGVAIGSPDATRVRVRPEQSSEHDSERERRVKSSAY
jgi:hypothetical protein